MNTIPMLICALFVMAATNPCMGKQTEPDDVQRDFGRVIKDLDSDGIRDTVYFDNERSVIVCRLSSHGFRPVESMPIATTNDPGTYAGETPEGFYFANHWMRTGYDNFFWYEPKTKKIRLIKMSRYEFGNAANDGSGESSVDMLTGEYIGNWNYYDYEEEELIVIPTIKTAMPFPAIYLDDFDEEIYFGYGEKDARLYNLHKEKMISPQPVSQEEEESQTEVHEIVLNDDITVRVKHIPESEYTVRKQASAHLRQSPLKIVTDINEVVDMLGGSLKVFDKRAGDTFWQEHEITFKDGNKEYIDWENAFVAFYPELETLLFDCNGGDRAINLNDSTTEGELDPEYCVISFDKRWRINGRSPDYIAYEDYNFFLEEWNEGEKRYERVGGRDMYMFAAWGYGLEWVWISDNTALFTYVPHYREEINPRICLEIEVVAGSSHSAN